MSKKECKELFKEYGVKMTRAELMKKAHEITKATKSEDEGYRERLKEVLKVLHRMNMVIQNTRAMFDVLDVVENTIEFKGIETNYKNNKAEVTLKYKEREILDWERVVDINPDIQEISFEYDLVGLTSKMSKRTGHRITDLVQVMAIWDGAMLVE